MVKTRHLALRVFQNRTGLVPRPSWCTYRVRPDIESSPMMSLDEVRSVFGQLGQLDLVRLCGPDPLLRSDLDEVAETILEASRPSILHLSIDGQSPEPAEEFARGFSEARRLRFLVRVPSLPDREAPFVVHRQFTLCVETLKRLKPVARERGFKVSALLEVELGTEADAVHRLRTALAELGVELYVAFPSVPPSSRTLPMDSAWMRVVQGELEHVEHRPRGLHRTAERYLHRGSFARLQGDPEPKPQPKCTSLRSHVRVEPDGTVPTCGFNAQALGNLAESSFEKVWFGSAAERGREFVDGCRGCWSADEALPSALYSGDLVGRWGDRGIAGSAVNVLRRRWG